MTRTLAAVLCAALAGIGAAIADDDAMKNEDVVRMLVAGAATDEVLEAIARREPEFDLTDEMLDELRLAGVPDAVIDAMRDRQRDVTAAEEPAVPQPTTSLRLELRAGSPEIVFPAVPDRSIRQAYGLGGDDTEVTDLALFLACGTATHVPDHWRSASPLGRDFRSMPRHGILAFRPGALRGDDGLLRLEIPARLAADPPADGPHDLIAGLAAEIGGRWLVLASIARTGVDAGGETPSLGLEIRIGVERDAYLPRLDWVGP